MLKEVIAIVRPGQADATKAALQQEGFAAITTVPAEGRGRQGGLSYGGDPRSRVPYLPKAMLTILVHGDDVKRVVSTIIRTNRTGEIGDGKIFVSPLTELRRIRTRQHGAEALR